MDSCNTFAITKNAPPKWKYRFWSLVDVQKAHACWNWRGSFNRDNGYGRLKAPEGGDWVYAHRVAYTLHHDSPLSPLYACHQCDNPACCNPYHIYAGSQSENMLDRQRQPRSGPLSVEERWRIHAMHKEGLSNTEIAGLIGVRQSTISRAVSGRR